MSYSIRYDSVRCPKNKQSSSAGKIVITLILCVCIVGAIALKSLGLPWIRQVLLPGDPEVTASALEHLVEDLRGGDRLWNAVTAFCREIVDNA